MSQDPRAGAITTATDCVVVIGWDLANTERRRAKWRTQTWVAWGATALPLSLLLGWFVHPLLLTLAVATFTVPLQAERLRQFAWARPGASAVWLRLRADPSGLHLDHLFGVGCPPPARVLDPTASSDRMSLGLQALSLTWAEATPLKLDGNQLHLGRHCYTFDGIDPSELQEALGHVEALRR